MTHQQLGKTNLSIPPLIFGTSCLGNLYHALPEHIKAELLANMFQYVEKPVVIDTAGKYGAGLALEVIGKGLRTLKIPRENVVLSNKLGWRRVPLQAPEPTFEPGVWADIAHDAVQDISYDGILRCWEQGCQLLGEEYVPQLVSVHDPDEYLAQADSQEDKMRHFDDILDAYRALRELKQQRRATAIGVGAKDWKSIRAIAREVELDWVMFANSLTIFSHPPELLQFIEELRQQQIGIINSAVFNAGFLTGGAYFNYREVRPDNAEDRPLFQWRERFFALCAQHQVAPAVACVQFGMSPPGVVSIALNTSKPQRIRQNVASVMTSLPDEFWKALKAERLIDQEYPYVG